jgi:hypothetical protein
MVKVDPYSLQEIRYDPVCTTMELDFKDGSTYQYYDVSRYAFEDLVAAKVKEEFAIANVYKLFRQKKIR